jgi:hypothetical protein
MATCPAQRRYKIRAMSLSASKNVRELWVRGEGYMGESRNWEDIVRELSRETDPRRRRKLERDLGRALERAGFQKLSRQNPLLENDDDQVEEG